MITLPIEYSTNKFFEYAGYPEKTAFGFRASCPMCMEGSSWGQKKRLYYFPREHYMYCHNGCGSFSDYYWVKQVSGLTFAEIKSEIENGFDVDEFEYDRIYFDMELPVFQPPKLPKDSINLLDKTQLLYYKDNYWVKLAVSFLQRRKLMTAPYRAKSFYLSLNDTIHKNRIVIPFYDCNGEIEFYQSRALTEKQEKYAKFLSKLNSDKSIFNIDKVDFELDYIFIMEGAIDSMFLKNGLAISGVTLTDHQQDILLNNCPFSKRIWLFDNPKIDETAKEKMFEHAKTSKDLFFTWTDQFEKYKDLNEFCVQENVRAIDPDEIVKRSFVGAKSLLRI